MDGSCILFIDGENFLHKVGEVLEEENAGVRKEIVSIDLKKLIETSLPNIKIKKTIFYVARLKEYKETLAKSRELIAKQRALKSSLEKQGIEVIIAGNVRGQVIMNNGRKKIIFKEKGVDVRMAVDMVSMSCDKEIETAILCSSDSDLQPAVAECKKRGVKVFYLGFELIPNKGLVATTDRSILFRNSDILSCVQAK